MLHQMKLRQKPYDGIKTGYKTIELRLYDKKRQKINAGDEIEFTCTENENEKITKKVSKIEVFDNFEQLFKGVPLLACGYSPFEIQIASADDMNAYYFEEVQRKYKAVAIYLEEKPFQRSMKVKKLHDGQLLVTMKALNDELLFRWVLGYADSAEVIKPISLRNRLREFSYFLESTYRKSPW